MNLLLIKEIAIPVFCTALGALLNRYLELKPKLIVYYSHISHFNMDIKSTKQIVNTHTIVVKNIGKKTANNVRIAHNILPPDFSVSPANYSVIDLPNGGKEILIPKIVPYEEYTISYLYLPPLMFNQINGVVKSDEGLAKGISILPVPQPPKWKLNLLRFLVLMGFIFTLYIIIELGKILPIPNITEQMRGVYGAERTSVLDGYMRA